MYALRLAPRTRPDQQLAPSRIAAHVLGGTFRAQSGGSALDPGDEGPKCTHDKRCLLSYSSGTGCLKLVGATASTVARPGSHTLVRSRRSWALLPRGLAWPRSLSPLSCIVWVSTLIVPDRCACADGGGLHASADGGDHEPDAWNEPHGGRLKP